MQAIKTGLNMICSKLPGDMTESELREVVQNTDFFGGVDSFSMWCNEELNRRETASFKGVSSVVESLCSEIENTDFSCENMKEFAELRSEINKELGQSITFRLKNSGASSLSAEQYEQIDILADEMNNQFYTYSDMIKNRFAPNGFFHRDDIIDILLSVSSLSDTQKEISAARFEQEQNRKELEQFFDSIDFSETGQSKQNRESDICCDVTEYFDTVTGDTLKTNHVFEKCTTPIVKIGTFMTAIYKADFDEAKLFKAMVKKAPKQARYAVRNTLNDMAREMRPVSIDDLKDTMTIRNKGLTKKSIQYQRASIGGISEMQSLVGSKGIAVRFTGFGEQEQKRVAKRKRIISKKGRGRKRAKLKEKFRMNAPHANINSLVGKKNIRSESQAMAYMIRLRRKNRRLPGGSEDTFVVTKTSFGGRMRKGVYQIKVRKSKRDTSDYSAGTSKILRIQYEPRRKKSLQPKRNPWLTRSSNRYMKTTGPRQAFKKNMIKQVEFARRMR